MSSCTREGSTDLPPRVAGSIRVPVKIDGTEHEERMEREDIPRAAIQQGRHMRPARSLRAVRENKERRSNREEAGGKEEEEKREEETCREASARAPDTLDTIACGETKRTQRQKKKTQKEAEAFGLGTCDCLPAGRGIQVSRCRGTQASRRTKIAPNFSFAPVVSTAQPPPSSSRSPSPSSRQPVNSRSILLLGLNLRVSLLHRYGTWLISGSLQTERPQRKKGDLC